MGTKNYKSIVKWYINRTKTEFGSGNEYFDAFRNRKCISSFLLRFGDVENESTTYLYTYSDYWIIHNLPMSNDLPMYFYLTISFFLSYRLNIFVVKFVPTCATSIISCWQVKPFHTFFGGAKKIFVSILLGDEICTRTFKNMARISFFLLVTLTLKISFHNSRTIEKM